MTILYLGLYFIAIFTALGLGLLCARSDMRSMTIPNIYVGGIAVSFAAAYLAAHLGGIDVFDAPRQHIGGAVLVLGLTFAMYFFKALGAGDSKMAAVYALWVGMGGLLPFLFYTAIFGALLAAATLLLVRKPLFREPLAGGWIARAQGGARVVPYGVAIFVGAALVFLEQNYLTLTGWAAAN